MFPGTDETNLLQHSYIKIPSTSGPDIQQYPAHPPICMKSSLYAVFLKDLIASDVGNM